MPRKPAFAYRPRSSFLPSAALSLPGALAVAACLAACASTRSAQKRLDEEAMPPQPSLAVAEKFAGGSILAQGRLTSLQNTRPQENEPMPESDANGVIWRSMEDSEMSAGGFPGKESIEVLRARRAMLPRMALTISFTNTTAESVTFSVVEVRSLLGNFAPRPDQFTLAPGRDGALDPMLSNLPANLDELEVTLTLRHGDQSETRVLKLLPAPSAAVLFAPGVSQPAIAG